LHQPDFAGAADRIRIEAALDRHHRFGKLTDTYGESEVCAVIQSDFLGVVDAPGDCAEAEQANFPGVIGADRL
jgi:hypothetical protein